MIEAQITSSKKAAELSQETLGEMFKSQVLPLNTHLTTERRGHSKTGEGAHAGCGHWQTHKHLQKNKAATLRKARFPLLSIWYPALLQQPPWALL